MFVKIDGSHLVIISMRNSLNGDTSVGDHRGIRWRLAYVLGPEVAASTIGDRSTLSISILQHFRYEVVERSGYLESDTRAALETAESWADIEPLVQISILGTRHQTVGNMNARFCENLDADVWDVLQEITTGDHNLTIWFLAYPSDVKNWACFRHSNPLSKVMYVDRRKRLRLYLNRVKHRRFAPCSNLTDHRVLTRRLKETCVR